MKKNIKIPAGSASLEGNLAVPENTKGIVLFAHGSGSSRFSPRNRFVAGVLQKAGFATLLMDLLTAEEEKIDECTAELRFDVEMLAERLVAATKWLKKNEKTKNFSVGYFGASTGAAAALIAATKVNGIKAIVSRGGRPDLAMWCLEKVKTPTLLIVGGDDTPVIEMNRESMKFLRTEKMLEIVPGATHLFEELGKLEIVARLAADWFMHYLK